MRWVFYGVGLAALPFIYLVVALVNEQPIEWGGLAWMAFIISVPFLAVVAAASENKKGSKIYAGLSKFLSRLGGRRATKKIKVGEQFVSSFADFRCGPFSFPTTAEYAFGPHGGTVVLTDEFMQTRIDVEEFAPSIEGTELEEMRDGIYQGYLMESTLPLVRSGVPQAELLKAEFATIKGCRVLQSAILMPETNGIRGQVQYTNGRFMFTVSRITTIPFNQPPEKQLQSAFRNAEVAFGLCEFAK
ncbi:MAG: hypothetical protein ACU84J_14115 [Gammaproteobacteria bacterium]